MNPEKLKNRHGKVWLNVGSGNFLMEDFVNVDSNYLSLAAPIYPLVRPFLKERGRKWLDDFVELKKTRQFMFAHCGKPLPLPAGSVDHILASHFLEHLYQVDAVKVVQSFHALLKKSGTLHLIIPDIEAMARRYVQNIGTREATDAFVDHLGYHRKVMPNLAVRLLRALSVFDRDHLWMYDQYSLTTLCSEQGFEVMKTNDTPSASWRANDLWQVNLAFRKK